MGRKVNTAGSTPSLLSYVIAMQCPVLTYVIAIQCPVLTYVSAMQSPVLTYVWEKDMRVPDASQRTPLLRAASDTSVCDNEDTRILPKKNHLAVEKGPLQQHRVHCAMGGRDATLDADVMAVESGVVARDCQGSRGLSAKHPAPNAQPCSS